MESKLEAYNERQKDRSRARRLIIAVWVIYGIVSGLALNYIPDITGVLFAIGYFGVILSFFWYLFHLGAESYEMDICAELVKAKNLLRISKNETGNTGKRRRRNSAKHVESALEEVQSLINRTRSSEIVQRTINGKLSTLKFNMEKFVVPKIILGEDLSQMEYTLGVLAKFFGEEWESLGVQRLDEINGNLGALPEPKEGIRTRMSSLRSSMKRKPVVVGVSLLAGFGLSASIIVSICLVSSLDIALWFGSHIDSFMLAGIGMSALIIEVVLRR